MNPVGITSTDGVPYQGGVGYIIIPVDLKRDDYIKSCFLQNRVSIKTEDGGYLHRVPVDPWVFNFIDFPDSPTDNGTQVSWINIPPYNHPIIIGRVPLNDILSGLSENQFKLSRVFKDSFVEISGNPKTGHLGLSINSDDNCEFYLNIYNKNSQGVLNINVQGDTKLVSSGNTLIEAGNSVTISTINSEDDTQLASIVQNDEEHKFTNQKFQINDGTDPITLGNQLKTILDNLFTMLGESTTTTSLGQMPLLNGQQIAALKSETSKILSQISFTD